MGDPTARDVEASARLIGGEMLPAIAPLRHAMRIPWDDDACDPWHGSNLSCHHIARREIRMVSPGSRECRGEAVWLARSCRGLAGEINSGNVMINWTQGRADLMLCGWVKQSGIGKKDANTPSRTWPRSGVWSYTSSIMSRRCREAGSIGIVIGHYLAEGGPL